MDPKEPKLLIVGTPRSGTLYTSSLLLCAGYDVQHEQWGEEGIVAWTGLFSDGIWGEYKPDCAIIHQIRDPIDTINSLKTIAPISYQYMHTKNSDIGVRSSLLSCIRAYAIWNKLCRDEALWSFRVEDLDVDHRYEVSKQTNTRKYHPMHKEK